ncbi:MAG: ribosome small subunit-dependent GTPase A, partial [Planctomycetota bacterium]
DPREQVLVANVHQLFMVGALKNPGFSSNRTDRILAACRWHEIPATLVFNKADLDKKGALMEKYRATYAGVPDLEILVTSAKDGVGIDDLKERLRGKVTVLYGPSGAGKSSLLNAIQPGLKIKEGKISSYWKQGRHTTTYSRLHRMDLGGYVVDTPGIRVFRPHGLTRSHVRDLFPDFAPYQAQCSYANCTHDHEPGCAVADASEEGLIPDTRYASYLSLLDEVDPDGAYDPEAEPEEPDLAL